MSGLSLTLGQLGLRGSVFRRLLKNAFPIRHRIRIPFHFGQGLCQPPSEGGDGTIVRLHGFP